MRKLRSVRKKSNKKTIRIEALEGHSDVFCEIDGRPIDPQHLLLLKLLPSAVKEFIGQVQAEVKFLCGERYTHGTGAARWGNEEGSVYLGCLGAQRSAT